MRWVTAHIRPVSAFGTPMKGDTLFGQLCWMLRYRHGEPALAGWLEGYTHGRPFLVSSDAFPLGLLPRPEVPVTGLSAGERKRDKARRFLPISALAKPLAEASADATEAPAGWTETLQPHNSISRATGTTGPGFDPFQMPRRWPDAELRLDLHLVHDPERLPLEILRRALEDVAAWGFGRDASIGLGRFQLEDLSTGQPAGSASSDAWLTLAPAAPQGGAWNTGRCFYRSFTRFGRHGGDGALGRNPFKAPILLADSGALLTPSAFEPAALFTGRGLGGDGRISSSIPATVHQGYAPVIPVRLGEMVS